MCSLVKLQDLVDLVEPPLVGFSETTSSGQMKNEAMELEEEEEEHMEDMWRGQGSLGEANLGLG
jgi:hypothetical protein